MDIVKIADKEYRGDYLSDGTVTVGLVKDPTGYGPFSAPGGNAFRDILEMQWKMPQADWRRIAQIAAFMIITWRIGQGLAGKPRIL